MGEGLSPNHPAPVRKGAGAQWGSRSLLHRSQQAHADLPLLWAQELRAVFSSSVSLKMEVFLEEVTREKLRSGWGMIP